MKKFYSLLLAVITSIGVSAQIDLSTLTGSTYSLPSSFSDSPSETYTDLSVWTRANGGGSSAWVTFQNRYRIWIVATSPQSTDDWLVSPQFTTKAGYIYKVTFKHALNSSDHVYPNIDVYASSINPASSTDNAATVTAAGTVASVKSTQNQATEEFTITPGDGGVFISFHVKGDECKGGINLYTFSIQEIANSFKPAAPTGLTATDTGEKAAKLTWTNPTQSVLGADFTAEQTVEQVLVFCDDTETPVATLTGAVTEWTHTDATVGDHTYYVAAVVAGVQSELSAGASVTVAPKADPLDLATFEANTYGPLAEISIAEYSASVKPNQWSQKKFHSVYATWNVVSTTIARVFSSSEFTADAYLATPQIVGKKGYKYELTIFPYLFSSTNYYESFQVFVADTNPCSGADSEAALALAGSPIFEAGAELTTSDKTTPVTLTYTPDADGIFQFAFHVGGTCKGGMCLDMTKFSIKEIEITEVFKPMAPTALSAAVSGEDITLTWTNPTKATNGADFTAEQTVEQILIFRDNFETPIATIDGDIATYTDTGVAVGTHQYAVAVIVAGAQSDLSSTVDAEVKGPKSLPWSSALYDDFSADWTTAVGPKNANSNDWNAFSAAWGEHVRLVSASTREDKYLLSPALDFAEDGYYKVSYKAWCYSSDSDFDWENYEDLPYTRWKMEVLLVDSNDPTNIIQTLATNVPLATGLSTVPAGAEVEKEVIVYGGLYRIAFHACYNTSSTGSHTYRVYNAAVQFVASGVEDIAIDSNATITGIFNLSGQAVNGDYDSLPAGIYIVTKTSTDGTVTVSKVAKH